MPASSTVLLTATSLVWAAGCNAAFRAAWMRARMASRLSEMLMPDALSRAKLARAARSLNAGALVLLTDDARLSDARATAAVLPPASLVIVRAHDAKTRAERALALV